MSELPRRLLIAVDTEETACRAVDYVIGMLTNKTDVEIGLIHFVPPLRPDIYESEAQRLAEQQKLEDEAADLLDLCRNKMIDKGFPEERVIIRKQIKDCPNLAQCIIDEQKTEEYGTVVVGRGSLSRLEEFLTGSLSSNLVQLADKCAIWVIT